MSAKLKKHIYRLFINITVATWATVMFLFVPACGSKEKPTAMIRYKIITAEWLIYSHRNPPFWAFEKGIYLEKFDSLFHVDASIKADTAYYYEPKKLWELRGNVHIQSQRGDKFDTELMFWDQGKEKIYSDKFIRIEQVDKVLTGYGFESNQQMTEYQIYNNTGIFTVEDNAVQADSTQTSK